MTNTAQITIVEGPPPDFALATQNWALSLLEGPRPFMVAHCQTRAFDAAKLVARCQAAWQKYDPIHLNYPTIYGTRADIEIVAVQAERLPEGDVLNLWVKVPRAE